MKRITFLSLLIGCGFVLMQSDAQALRVEPGHLLTSLTHSQRDEFLQALLNRGFPPQTATQLVQTAIVIRRSNPKPRVIRIIIDEDKPGELLPVWGSVVVDDTLQEAEVRTLHGDGDFNGPPRNIIDLSFGSAAIFQGTPSHNDLLRLQLIDRMGVAAVNSMFITFPIPPGNSTLQFSTGQTTPPPLRDLRFVFCGPRDISIIRITGNRDNAPDIIFNPPATPFDATIASVGNPVGSTRSTDFTILVTNNNTALMDIQVGLSYR